MSSLRNCEPEKDAEPMQDTSDKEAKLLSCGALNVIWEMTLLVLRK